MRSPGLSERDQSSASPSRHWGGRAGINSLCTNGPLTKDEYSNSLRTWKIFADQDTVFWHSLHCTEGLPPNGFNKSIIFSMTVAMWV